MHSLVGFTVKLLVSASIFWVCTEAALRALPSAIPPVVLARFAPELRQELGRGRFSTLDQTVQLERDDGGPPLRLWKPFTEKRYDFGDSGTLPVVRTDEMGFCNPPGSYRAHTTIDLIAIGDSFTWCHGIRTEDSWVSGVAELSGLSAYNLGHGGIGLYEELQILEHLGLPRSPKVVIMNVYEGNDLRDALRYQEHRNGSWRDNQLESWWHRNALLRRSYAANLWFAGGSWLGDRYLRSREQSAVNFRYRVHSPEHSIAFNAQNMDRDEVILARRLLAGDFDLEVVSRALESFAELSRQWSFVPVVSYTPSAHTVYAAQVAFEDPELAEVLAGYSLAQRRFFASKAAELAYTFVDLTPDLRRAAQDVHPDRLLYFPTTLHYTPRGHEVAAGALARALRELDLAD